MTLHDILRNKGSDVYSISPGATLRDVVRLLMVHNCGSLVVISPEHPRRIAGIITERDILRICSTGEALEAVTVERAMTAEVLTGHLDDSVAGTMGTMTENRIRHLPLVEDGLLIGMISIGDVVKAEYHELTAENHHLKNYIQS